MLDISMLIRLAAYAMFTGVATAIAATFMFPAWSQNGTGVVVVLIGTMCGLIYAYFSRKPDA